jgi:molybdopterin-guanine dinucleotide biosynthesis protein A
MTREQMRVLCGLATEGCGVVPAIRERTEPLAAVYPKQAAPELISALAGCDFSLQRLVRELIAAGKMEIFPVPDKDQDRYLSLNRPGDIKEGRFPNRPAQDDGGL